MELHPLQIVFYISVIFSTLLSCCFFIIGILFFAKLHNVLTNFTDTIEDAKESSFAKVFSFLSSQKMKIGGPLFIGIATLILKKITEKVKK